MDKSWGWSRSQTLGPAWRTAEIPPLLGERDEVFGRCRGEQRRDFPHPRVGSFLTQRGQAFPRVPLSSSNSGSFIFQPRVCKPESGVGRRQRGHSRAAPTSQGDGWAWEHPRASHWNRGVRPIREDPLPALPRPGRNSLSVLCTPRAVGNPSLSRTRAWLGPAPLPAAHPRQWCPASWQGWDDGFGVSTGTSWPGSC